MMIGNFTRDTGIRYKEGKLLFGIEILKRPRYMARIFKPYICFYFFRVDDYGEPVRHGGRARVQWGGWKEFISPIGIYIEIV